MSAKSYTPKALCTDINLAIDHVIDRTSELVDIDPSTKAVFTAVDTRTLLEEAAYNNFALDIPLSEAEAFAGCQSEPEPGTKSVEQIGTDTTPTIVAVTIDYTDPNAELRALIPPEAYT